MSDTEFVPYNKREDWADVVPIPQDDGPNPLVPITYAPDYRIASDYFRAIAQAGEKSERALELTEYIINENPAHYTIWQYRQEVLAALQKDLRQELEFLDDMASEHPKSYQIWQWVVSTYGLWEDEIPDIDRLIDEDIRNNSAWNQRFYVVSRRPGGFSEDDLDQD
ncbi:hypothetical protein HDV00_007898 [Rhizophlyctis rosea]|nr:hypothetical protein HDV00_007898 [Rhizophlyctis rosea]